MKKLLFSLAVVFLVSGCTDLQGRDVYNASEVGKQADISFGRIISERHVKIQEQQSGVGTMAGAAGGGLAGANVGNGNGSVAGAIAGALIGGLAGSAAEKAMSDHIGIEYIIKKTDGKTVSIVQNLESGESPLPVGQTVMIQTSGEYQKIASKKGNEQYQRVIAISEDEMPVTKRKHKTVKAADQ